MAASGRHAGKVAVITGGASGIGAATARRFAAEGARVAVADLNGPGAGAVAGAIRTGGSEALAVPVDVCDPAAVAAMVERTVETFGRLDILHCCAAVADAAPLVEQTPEGWTRVVAVSLTGTFLAARAAIPAMLRHGGGVVVTMASAAGAMAAPGYAAYGAAKAGVMSLTRSIAAEYGRQGVRAVCVCPGAVQTPPVEALGARALDAMARANLAGRLGRPDEIAALVSWLASDEAAFVTGTTVVADGGSLAATRDPVAGRGEPRA
jgi:NAD(P)-dependent dehydrogenase (short-subunit alcohol dehydrogenase family)